MPRVGRSTFAMALVAVSATPCAASAASLTFDKPCYVSGHPGRIALAGFTARAPVVVAEPELGSVVVTTDDAGAAVLPMSPPVTGEPAGPGSRELTFTATEQSAPSVAASGVARIAPRAFASADVLETPKAPRAWSFSGWTPGRPLFAHLRRGGRTVATQRFGLAAGPCGELTVRAPGLPGSGPFRTGLWSVQVDQRVDYSPLASPALRAETVVLPIFRAPGTAGLVTAAPGALPRFL